MATHYAKDGKNAYEIEELHPECPKKIPKGARYMTSARIDFEGAQDGIIEWYERVILKSTKPQTDEKQ